MFHCEPHRVTERVTKRNRMCVCGRVYVLFSTRHVANKTVTISGPLRLCVTHFVLNCPFLEAFTQTHHWNWVSLSKRSIHFPVNILRGEQVHAQFLPHHSKHTHSRALDSCRKGMCCLYPAGSQESDSSQTAKKDMLAALRARQDALEETLRQRLEELKSICIREAVWETQTHLANVLKKHNNSFINLFPCPLFTFPRSWQGSFPRNILWIQEKSHPQWDERSVPPSNWMSRKFFLRERWISNSLFSSVALYHTHKQNRI